MNEKFKDKIYIGVSGHRDLKQNQIEVYAKSIQEILKDIVEKNPNMEVIIISPLADGADRLVVYVAIKLGLRYDIVLPMSVELYQQDFNENSYKEFMQLYLKARDVKVIDLCNGCSIENIKEYNKYRDKQYLAVGQYVVDNSNFMIFLWDGVDNHLIGGTADIYKYAKLKKKDYIVINVKRESKKV